jgi:hypothetical protein
MANVIQVEAIDEPHFRVRVSDGKGESVHAITVHPGDVARLAG